MRAKSSFIAKRSKAQIAMFRPNTSPAASQGFLGIKVVESLDRAFEELEDTECGLSAGIFAKDPKVIARFKEQVDVPHTYVNQSSRSLGAANGAVLANFCR